MLHMRENLREIRLISHIETRTCGRRHTPHAHTHTYKQYIDASDSDSLSLSLGRMTYSDDDVDDIEVTIHHHHSSLSPCFMRGQDIIHIYIYTQNCAHVHSLSHSQFHSIAHFSHLYVSISSRVSTRETVSISSLHIRVYVCMRARL